MRAGAIFILLFAVSAAPSTVPGTWQTLRKHLWVEWMYFLTAVAAQGCLWGP